MKFTLSWLRDHLETQATLKEIVDRLTMIGLEVESVDDRAAFEPFVIARVLSAEKHPDADKLKLLMVDTGDGDPVQVVCGAPNARAGLVGAFAAPGAYIPGIDLRLGVGKIRGVESRGMMCSERELELSDQHEGIIDLPADAPVGTSFAAYAGLDDPVIEIGITPNRPDALSVAGIARDLAAAEIGELKPASIEPPQSEYSCPVRVTLEFPEGHSLCPAFGLRMVRGVRNGPSPRWMQQRLTAVGLRPISALVDITNYVTYDLGRPLHVFDADKIRGNLTVRRAREGETLRALDGRNYRLGPEMCIIADASGPESLAGIMGGEESGCTDETVNVLVESALWEPLNVARTGRELAIMSDARYRFERGVDPLMMAPGLDYAVNLILQICGGEASEAVTAGEVPRPDLVIDFPVAEIVRLTGLHLSGEAAAGILSRLGFGVSGTGSQLRVRVPTWRPDVSGKADLVEEVMRIHGVNEIPPQPLPGKVNVNRRVLTEGQVRTRNARRALAVRAMLEAVTWSFIPRNHAEAFGGGTKELALANPISSEMSHMRPSLLPGLAAAAQRNADRGFGDIALFEVSHVYVGERPDEQKRVAAGVRRGTAGSFGGGRHWRDPPHIVSVFDAKADALAVLEAIGVDASKVQLTADGPEWYHPGRRGQFRLGPGTVLAEFGEFHPMTLDRLGLSGPLCGFEVLLDAAPRPRRKATKTKPPLAVSDLQAVKRDYAFVLGKDQDIATLLRAAAGADRKLIVSVHVFDLFEDASLGEDKKSVAIEVTMQPIEKTLTDQEIDAISSKIVDNVRRSTGGVLRG
jgi:phenylalanyl-tRNA synthetase beta chain